MLNSDSKTWYLYTISNNKTVIPIDGVNWHVMIQIHTTSILFHHLQSGFLARMLDS